jgi:hypothetical protein
MAEGARSFDWSMWPIPVVPKELAETATDKPPMARFAEGFLHYLIPAYNTGERLDQTADFLMFLSAPDHLGALVGEHGGYVPNIDGAPLPDGLAALHVEGGSTRWTVDSLVSTHVSADLRDRWVENWRRVLLGEMTPDQYTATMQLELESAAQAELQ